MFGNRKRIKELEAYIAAIYKIIGERDEQITKLIQIIHHETKSANKLPTGALRSVSRSPKAQMQRAKAREEMTLRKEGVDVD